MTEAASPELSWLSTLPLLSARQRREVVSVFRRALVESPLPTTLTSTGDGRILGCNRQFEEMLGVDESVLHGQRVEDLVHPDDQSLTTGVLDRLSRGESTLERYEARWVRPDGRVVWTRRNVLRVNGPSDDGTAYLVAVIEDLTALRLSQQLSSALVDIGTRIAAGASLDQTVQRLTTLAEARWNRSGCLLTILDREHNVLRPIGLEAGTGQLLADLPPIPVGPAGGACGTAAWRDEPTSVSDWRDDAQDTPLHPVFAQHGVVSSWSVPLHDSDGQVIGTLGVFHTYPFTPTEDDWTAAASVAGVAAIAIIAEKRRQAASGEQHRLRTDPRTGLLNDVGLMEQADTLLSQREPVSLAVATLRGPGRLASLDSMARMALTTLATRAGALGQVPLVAATGVTSLAFVAQAEWGEREARLLHRILSRPIDIGSAVIRPEVAVGVAVSTTAGERVTAAELLAHATLAVPSRGGSRIVVPEVPIAARDHELAAEVARAFRQDQFVAYYQPQFDLITGEVIGAEALARWNHPDRGVLTPASFLPMVECTGASTELAFTLLRRIAADEARRLEIGLRGHVALNITADDLLNESFLQVLRDPEDRLWRHVALELTEAQFVRPDAVTALEDLAALGYSIALDDFGTGYSALSAIHTLPVSIVKIDQSFVSRLPHDASAEALIAAITAICAQLAITVVAEGIETEQQARALRDLGCRIGQGYLLGAPQPINLLTRAALRRREQAARARRTTRKVGDAARHRLLELHEQGASPASIAAALNRNGYRSPGGSRWNARSVLRFLNTQR
jgi:PAS domain S-box-containing protein